MPIKSRKIFFLIFALSGFSGLLYESIWSHYLKLFLGHAAYAQTLVLAIYMGGMAIGSWFCSRYSVRWGNLLKVYAAAEAVIGVCSLAFHGLFAHTIELSYRAVIPNLGNPLAITAYKWTISALLILPQSILLGMTFPLMSAGILRLFPEKPGRSIAMLYFTNSIGAAIGVLVSGFFLIRLAGLPGTMTVAGLINVILASVVWLLVKDRQVEKDGAFKPAEPAASVTGAGHYRLFLAASLVTGAASFIYEVGWIRMLNLVMGSSTHAFELMLSAFIFGLAFGGLWIQRRIDRIALPVRFLAYLQIIMGLFALGTLLVYANTFAVMQLLVNTLSKTDTGYALFNLSSSAIAIAVMLPATFCAGMTLPLITFVLLREGCGERSIGSVYAANTVGAIIGVFFAVHLGMPLLGLKGLIVLGACCDISLGIFLMLRFRDAPAGYRLPAAVCAAGICAVVATLGFVRLDPFRMGSGVYRTGAFLTPELYRQLFHYDGKTACVDVFQSNTGKISINTNGKTDASIQMGSEMVTGRGLDESTMILLAAIPMALHPESRSVATIGLGCGLTTHTLLCNPRLSRVDTVEIERGVVEAAQYFRPNVELAFSDPRSRIHLDDAKTFFSTHKEKYDLIISEPSNPWVSGVSGLFSEEFYRTIRRSMNDDGLFVQWVQLYEINTDLVVSILKAISSNFSDYAIYAANKTDIMIVARNGKPLPGPDVFRYPLLTESLRKIQVLGVQDIAIRKIGSKQSLGALTDSFPIAANSDYYPVVDQNAARTRFLNSSAIELLYLNRNPFPVLDMLSGSQARREATVISPSTVLSLTRAAFGAMGLRDYLRSGVFDSRYQEPVYDEIKQQAMMLGKLSHQCNSVPDSNDRCDILFKAAAITLPNLSQPELETIWQGLESGPCGATFTATDRRYVALFSAIGRRDAPRIADTARELMQSDIVFNPMTARIITTAGMLGYLMQGKKEESFQFWTRYKSTFLDNREPDLLCRLLVAESRSR
jgi:spermidine synthase